MRSEKELFYKFLAQTSPEPLALEIVKAAGSYLYARDGKKYLDFISGIGVSSIGHSHPAVIQAVTKQASEYMHLMVYGEYVEAPQVKLAHKLASLLPPSLSRVYFVNSGAEAIEGAIKLAKRYTGRHEIMAFKKAYHGSTHGALSIMGDEALKKPFRPLLPGIKFLNYNNFNDLNKISFSTAAVVVEAIQAEAGVVLPEKDFLKKLEEKCRQTGTLLIVDEIQTGLGRTGKMFAFQQFGIVPDIITLAKALGGGLPLGAFIASDEIMATLSQPALSHITTFGGNPVACAASLAVLNVITDQDILNQIPIKENLIKKSMKGEKYKVHGLGLFLAINFQDKDLNFKIIGDCIKNGLIADWFLFSDTSLRIAPPLTISESEIEEACAIINKAIEKNTTNN